MQNLPPELFLNQLLKLPYEDIKNVCMLDKNIESICQQNEDYIYSELIKKTFPCFDISNRNIYILLKHSKVQNMNLYKRNCALQNMYDCDETESDFSKKMNSYFDMIKNTKGANNKVVIMITLFDYLTTCKSSKKILLTDATFRSITLNKINYTDEFTNKDNTIKDSTKQLWKAKSIKYKQFFNDLQRQPQQSQQ